MSRACINPVVHLELETANLPRACAFYTQLLGWRAETIASARGSYLALGLGNAIEGGVVERDTELSLWLPYVQVSDVASVTDRARALGADVTLEPREGPVGWRSLLVSPSGEKLALWQSKTWEERS
jgi:predicted enzyme related to lactoylglutathione lyase